VFTVSSNLCFVGSAKALVAIDLPSSICCPKTDLQGQMPCGLQEGGRQRTARHSALRQRLKLSAVEVRCWHTTSAGMGPRNDVRATKGGQPEGRAVAPLVSDPISGSRYRRAR
jgi:hypothetical protein